MSILSFAFFERNSAGREPSGENEPPGSESASAAVRLLQADTSNSYRVRNPEAPAGPATDEGVAGPTEATHSSGSSESDALSMVTTIPVPASQSLDEHAVEQHRQDVSVLVATVDAGHGSESEARRSSDMDIAGVREQLARVQDETEKRLAQMNHQLTAATDKAQTAVALKSTAELEIGRIREETERKLARMEEQLAA